MLLITISVAVHNYPRDNQNSKDPLCEYQKLSLIMTNLFIHHDKTKEHVVYYNLFMINISIM